MRMLNTERLQLEPLAEAHAEEMFDVLVEPIIYTFLHERPPFTEEELRVRYRFLAKRRSPDGNAEWLCWIVREEGGDACGLVHAEVHPGGIAGIAVVLSPRVWRLGYGREAVAAVIRELAQNRSVTGFFATLSPRNAPAVQLFEKLGFRLREHESFDLRAVDDGDVIYACGRAAR